MPLFSIIIPTYNRAGFIEKAVESVLNQTCQDFELIVIDDGSTDGTVEILRNLSVSYASSQGGRLNVIAQENHGVAHARNRGIEQARGEWICFLDSDDWFLPEKLAVTKEAVRQNPDHKIFHTQETWFRSGEVLPQKTKHTKPNGYVYENAVEICSISISTACVHASVFADVGLFDEAFEACEDYEFWLRTTHQYPVHLIDQVLTEKDGGRPDQLSARVWGLDRFRIRALDKIMNTGVLNSRQQAITRRAIIEKCSIFLKGAKKHNNEKAVRQYARLMEQYS